MATSVRVCARVIVWERRWDGDCWILLLIIQTSAHWKGDFNTARFYFQFPVQDLMQRAKYQPKAHPLFRETTDFIKQQWEEKTDHLSFKLHAFPLSGLQWLPERPTKPRWHCGRFICLFCSSSSLFVSF